MKNLMALLITMVMATPAFAKMTTEQFIDTLVDSINQQLVVVNKERAEEGKKLYCNQLNEKQVNIIASKFRRNDGTLKSLNSVNASQMVLSLGDDLTCYPKLCKAYADLVHGICNMKAAKMDRDLVTAALEDIKGDAVYAADTVEDVANP